MNSTAKNSTCGCGCGGRGCGCCEGIAISTPQPTANRPGQDALRYRIGTHGSFLQTMKARLSGHALGGPPAMRPLAGLRTREGTDPAIALLDCWATVADVLTFYQERIANEGYLRTATELRSMFELARLVGYRPRPGVAASVYLSYTIDANTAQDIIVPQGSRAQTIPGQDEQPQIFETVEDLKARAAWNRLGVRQTEPQRWDAASDMLYLAGTHTLLKAGDPLLISAAGEEPRPYRVLKVEENAKADRTAVTVERWDTAAAKKEVRAMLLEAAAAAPPGKKADQVKGALTRLQAIHRDDLAFAPALTALHDLVRGMRATLERDHLPAPKLKPWLADVAAALGRIPAGTAAAAPAKGAGMDFSDRIALLSMPPSRPLAGALQLPRSLLSDFDPIGDAGVKLLGAVAPALRSTLAAALAGDQAASPDNAMQVWALRLKAGLFGRTFPRRTMVQFVFSDGEARTVSGSRTVDGGEWPIVTGVTPAEGEQPLVIHATEATDRLYLDNAVDGIAPESWVFVDTSGVDTGELPVEKAHAMVEGMQPFLVARVAQVFPKVARAAYGGSGDSTAIDLGNQSTWLRFVIRDAAEFRKLGGIPEVIERDFSLIRRTAVYARSELLPLAEQPITAPLCSHNGSTQVRGSGAAPLPIELDGLYADLEPGRFVIVSGERTDIDDTLGVFATEAAMITAVVHDVRAATRPKPRTPPGNKRQAEQQALAGDRNHTFIWLDQPLSYCYRRATVALLGNVVKATHGETRIEVLGNGNGATPLQHFALKQAPLTHVAAGTASGVASTLSIYVNDVRWQESAGFLGLAPTDRVFRTQTDDTGKTTIQFGNGHEGARLPTGIGNVKAIYRNGIGRPGNAHPGQIQQLASRPLGVREVTNPLRASGGADPEGRDRLRRNLPLAAKALDRLVSAPDYADFSRTFAGIGKAEATRISDGRRKVVHVTVAGIDDIPVDSDSDLLRNLRRALRDLGDPFQPLAVAPRELRLLIVSAGLRIDADRSWEPVVAAVRAALVDAFGFARREVAQGTASSEVLSVIQAVPGVAWVDLDVFGAIDTVKREEAKGARPLTPGETANAVMAVVDAQVAPAVEAKPARRASDGKTILPAQLALLSADVPETLVLNQLKP
ncbi:putative baseplate assembly protein [Massilia aurea]|uniref:putative baseplate assembly protein n=1 Tax=Massilia aurea TaxID=373040 RepID=UPI003462BAA9